MRNWRPFTWVILGINLLFLVWVIAGFASGGEGVEDCLREARNNPFLNRKDCQTAGEIGTAVGVGIVVFLWALADFILGVIWLITRSNRRTCPACGTPAKKGVFVCRSCGHDFRTGVTPAPVEATPGGATTGDQPPYWPPPPDWKPSE